MISYARSHPVDVRFIEIMPIGAGKTYSGVSNEELLRRIREKYPALKEDISIHGNGPACYYSIPGFAGGVGFISAMHGKFCNHCNRIRMSAQGEIKPCLCYGTSVDLRRALRKEFAKNLLKEAIYQKPQAHCFERADEITENKKMISIGG